MRDPRLNRRYSQATPRLSLVWTSINLENKQATPLTGLQAEEPLDVAVTLNMADDQDTKKRKTLSEFCCNNVKSISTIILMFGMFFCVVMIVMVHKWNYEKDEDIYISTCQDLAIIGAGISGTYAAWCMRHSDQSIHVYDMADEPGGLFRTWRNESLFPDLEIELGVTSFHQERQPRLARLILATQPPLSTSRPPSPAPPTFYLRGRHLTTSSLHNGTGAPYNLNGAERFRSPKELMQWLLRQATSNDTDPLRDPLLKTTRDKTPLYQQGFRSVLRQVASNEAMQLLADTSPWRHILSDQNAALLFEAAALPERDFYEERVIEGGMQSLPKALLREFLETPGSSHGFSGGRRLACIRDEKGVYQLIFIKTRTDPGTGHPVDERESEEVCAHKVLLAIPPLQLQHLEWVPPTAGMYNERHVKDAVNTHNTHSQVVKNPSHDATQSAGLAISAKNSNGYSQTSHNGESYSRNEHSTQMEHDQSSWRFTNGEHSHTYPPTQTTVSDSDGRDYISTAQMRYTSPFSPTLNEWKERLESVSAHPVMRVYCWYSSPWWNGDGPPPHTDIYTDLPVRHIRYMGQHYDTSGGLHSVFLCAEVQRPDLSYLSGLVHTRVFNGSTVLVCNNTKRLVQEISRNMAAIYGEDSASFPKPSHILVHDWSSSMATGNWYTWKRGVFWNDVAQTMIHPFTEERVFLAGNAYCRGICQLDVEGALRSVDNIVDTYLLPSDNT